jgi:L-fuculose-phosphate aldolase
VSRSIPKLRRDVVATARAINESGLNPGKSGNASVRVDEGFLITPTGVPYARLTPASIVSVSMDGSVAARQLKPSSEWRIHRDVYAARADAHAIVHAHSPYATALACARRGIPAFHYMVAIAGGADIRCARYATFGTQRLSDLALGALRDRRACLLANHGLIAIGDSLAAAFALATEVEFLARQYVLTLQVGRPVLLKPAQMRAVLEKFKSYGQQE